ncbi:MAG TPA: addiction module protein [Thermoanaerobaculia bacterium]
MTTIDEVLRSAMELTEEERLLVSSKLLESVPVNEAREQAWLAESDRRLARLLSGEDPGLTLEEFWADDKP